MTKPKLNQYEAVTLEALRAKGLTNDELLELLRHGDVETLEALGAGNFDYSQVLELAKTRWGDLVEALSNGYQVKYNTINGIKSLLKFKFGRFADRDYPASDERIEGLFLEENELSLLRSLLSDVWAVTVYASEEQPERSLVRIELKSNPS